MKKTVLAAMVAIAFGVGSASAAVIVSDTFTYADGSLVPNGGWTNHSGTVGDLLVTSGEAVVQHGVPSEDAHLEFTAVQGSIYYALDFRVSASGQIIGGDYEYFAHFTDGGTFNFRARLDVVEAPNGGDFSVGISTATSTAEAVWPSDLSFGTTYRAVVRYDQDANIAELWVNPTVETDPSILGADGTDPGDTILWMALRQSDSSLNETVYVDNLCVGTSFSDVVSCSTVSVEESTWSTVKSLYGEK
jgi:hypothetical protein